MQVATLTYEICWIVVKLTVQANAAEELHNLH